MNKKTLSEADICDKFITPALQQGGWDLHEQIFRKYTQAQLAEAPVETAVS